MEKKEKEKRNEKKNTRTHTHRTTRISTKKKKFYSVLFPIFLVPVLCVWLALFLFLLLGVLFYSVYFHIPPFVNHLHRIFHSSVFRFQYTVFFFSLFLCVLCVKLEISGAFLSVFLFNFFSASSVSSYTSRITPVSSSLERIVHDLIWLLATTTTTITYTQRESKNEPELS